MTLMNKREAYQNLYNLASENNEVFSIKMSDSSKGRPQRSTEKLEASQSIKTRIRKDNVLWLKSTMKSTTTKT